MRRNQLLSRRMLVQRVCRGAAGLAAVRVGIGCTPATSSTSGTSGASSSSGTGTSRPIFDACIGSGEKASRVLRDFDNGRTLGVASTPSFFVNGARLNLLSIPVFADFEVALLNNPTDPQSEPLLAVADDDHVKGNRNAAGTIIEYGDFQCPACGSFFAGTYPSVVTSLVDTGQAKYVFRHFPLPQHANAQAAAEAAECAADQGQFFPYHDLLFENQTQLEPADLQGYADELGLG